MQVVSLMLAASQALGLLTAAATASPVESPVEPRMRGLLDRSGDRASRVRIATSRDGRPIDGIVLGAAQRDLASGIARQGTPALLLLAGIDGRHHEGVELAFGVAEQLLADEAELLEETTVYVVPCLNPDALARHLTGEQPAGFGGSVIADDEDHDGRRDEDPPQDVDGDGRITWMRVFDPPPGVPRTHMVDPEEPRLSRPADPIRGERATHAWMIEGLDQDGDGRFADDREGGVDLDRNFPHHWPEHQPGAGPYALSEPETQGLVDWLLTRHDIACAAVIGTGDNVRNVPESGKRDYTNRAPDGVERDDHPYHEEIKRLYEATVGERSTSKASTDGSCHVWLYAHYGVPTFAVDVSRDRTPVSPTAGDEPDEEGSENAEEPEGGAAEESPGEPEDASSGRVTAAERKRPAVEKDELDWLGVFDRTGEGFVPFRRHAHPQLGDVEIGGPVVGFRVNPSAAGRAARAESHAAFVAELLLRLPRLRVGTPVVAAQGAGLYRVRIAVENVGYLPSISAIGERVRRALPPTLRIEVDDDRLVSGERIQRGSAIAGSGGRFDAEWWVLGDAGEQISITLRSSALGETTIPVTLEETR